MKNSNGMKTLKIISINSVILTLLVVPFFINADTSVPPTTVTPIKIDIPNPTNAGSDLMSVLVTLLNKVVMPIAAVAVVVWIVWAGFGYVIANGNPTKIEKAHQRLLYALIGAGILLGAAAISAVVERTVKGLLV